jgi:uncharacterized membrane protein YhhN
MESVLLTLSVIFSFIYITCWAIIPQLSSHLLSDINVRVLFGSIIKPLPIILFSIIAFSRQNKNSKYATSRLTGWALAFSSVGDVLLDLDSSNNYFFLAGLSFFLLAHLVYAISFAEYKISHSWINACLFSFLPFVSISIHWLGIPSSLRFAVFIYSCVIAYMAYVSFSAKLGDKRLRALIGVILFIVSDSMLASDRFGPLRIPQAKFFVMITYYSAQYMLLSFCVR